MFRMSKARITVTVSRDLLERVDRWAARAPGQSRSSVVEGWLRAGCGLAAERDLESEISAYYDRLGTRERTESQEWARFSTASFFRRERRKPASANVRGRGRRR